MKLNLSVEKDGVEYRICAYGYKQDLTKVLEAFQCFGALTVYCSMRDEDKKETSETA